MGQRGHSGHRAEGIQYSQTQNTWSQQPRTGPGLHIVTTRKTQPQDALFACIRLSKIKEKEDHHNCQLDKSNNCWNTQSLLNKRQQKRVEPTLAK